MTIDPGRPSPHIVASRRRHRLSVFVNAPADYVQTVFDDLTEALGTIDVAPTAQTATGVLAGALIAQGWTPPAKNEVNV